MKIDFEKKFALNDWLSVGAVLTAVASLICYSVMKVGEFHTATVVMLAFGILLSILSVLIKFPYFDLAAFIFYTVAFFLFIESKVFYISAVFVGIDYKAFDPCFLANFIVGLINMLSSAMATFPLTKEKI